jgi:hypothetical protein
MSSFHQFERSTCRMFRNSVAVQRAGRKSLLLPLPAGRPLTLRAVFLEFSMRLRISKCGEGWMTTDGLPDSHKVSADVD